jgi:hypothetical protein
MINKFNLAKALRDQSDIVATANSYVLVGNGEGFESDVDASHIEEIVLYNDDDSVGLGNNSSDIQIGIYQLSVHSPKSEKKWAGLVIIGVLNDHFVRGLKPSFGGQEVIIETASLSPMMQNDTHLIHHLSVKFSVIN